MNYRVEDISSDKIEVWLGSTGYTIDRSDLESFIKHMDDWYSVRGLTLSRSEYEDLYSRYSLGEAKGDDDLGCYGDIYGDYGMDHYHTDPENRSSGMRGELDQGRWRGILEKDPEIEVRRERERNRLILEGELSKNRESWPGDLDKFIGEIGGYERLYEMCKKSHSNNSVQLRDEGLHMEWLIGHAVKSMAIEASYGHPDYREASHPCSMDSYFPYLEQADWWADWSRPYLLVSDHPLKRISARFSDRRLEPYMGRVEYFGYGEDCGDDVRSHLRGL